MKKLVVLGGGISGYGSAILARRKGFDVFLSDSGRIADRYRMKLEAWGVPYEEGGHSEERILAASECVKSPGIPDSAPIVRKLRERGVPVISEIEFAGRYLDGARTICITGSNGKTTTTSLVYRILRDAGCNVALGGNIGESFAYSVATGRYDWYVLELSSFQLDGMFRFRADIGVLTNITPDHLDRYDHSFAKYAAAKMRIAQNQRAGDYFIYSADDETIWSLLPSYRLPQRQLPFAARAAVAGSDGDAFLSRDGRFTAAVGDRSVEIDTRRMRIGGLHNAYNAMAAALAALAAGVAPDRIRRSIYAFAPVEHRLEPVRETDQRFEGDQRRFGVVCARKHETSRGVDRRRHRQGQRLRTAQSLRPREGAYARMHGCRQPQARRVLHGCRAGGDLHGVAGRGDGGCPPCGASGRRRAAVARLRLVRSVPQLRTARRAVQKMGRRTLLTLPMTSPCGAGRPAARR
jgi:UDP-N-acetylmuramoylalanine--D-glutamate ligase